MELALAFGIGLAAFAVLCLLVSLGLALSALGRMADRLVALHSVPATDALGRLRAGAVRPAEPEKQTAEPDLSSPAPLWDARFSGDFETPGN